MTASRRNGLLSLLLALLVVTAACSSGKATGGGSEGPGPVQLRLGYLPNLTQAAAVVGVQNKTFAQSLGPGVTLTASTYKAGPDEVQALLSGALDAAYIGPNPAVNAFQVSSGAVKVIAGATSGGASLMTKYSIKTAADLKGQKVASPELGNTQDVALRTWLRSQGLNPDVGGNVSVTPQPNATTLQQFQQNGISAAWVPEPWASRLQVEGNAKVLVDEASLWPDGKFPTTVLVVRTEYLKAHPGAIDNLLIGHVAATAFVASKSARAQTDAATAIKTITGQTLSTAVSDLAWNHLTFTSDPLAAAIQTDANNAQKLGQIRSAKLSGMYELTALNTILKAAGQPEVSAG